MVILVFVSLFLLFYVSNLLVTFIQKSVKNIDYFHLFSSPAL